MSRKDRATSTSGASYPLTPPTILECFEQSLPAIKDSDNIKYKSVKPSSTTTNNTVPPKVLICQEASELIKIADKILKSSKMIESRLSRDPINTVNSAFTGDTEMDVVAASLAAIVLPIQEILNVLYPGIFEISSEHNKKVVIDMLEEEEEDFEGKRKSEPTLRCDFVYKKRDGKGNRMGQIIAVLEYKRRGLLRYKDWEDAIVPQDASEDDIMKVIDEVDTSHQSKLNLNANSYTKQVAAYAVKRRCKHVAIFNWDHALFFLFDESVQGGADAVGERVNFTWGTEDKKANKNGQNHFAKIGTLRKMILGWVLRAFDEALDERKDS